MRFTIRHGTWLFTVLLPALFGCSSSLNALYHDDECDAVFDPNLVGQWTVEPDERFTDVKNKDAFIQIARIGGSKAYLITAPGSRLPDESLEARMVEIGGMRILDLTNPRLAAARHDFVKVQIGDDRRLRVNGFNHDLLRKKPQLLAHTIEPLYLDLSSSGTGIPVPRWIADAGITITASTEDLRQFFAEHADDASIWHEPDKPLILKRRADK